MKILVFVNHVPDTETKVKVGADAKSIDPTGVNYMLSPYDEFGVEEGLKTKQQLGGEVVVVSLGGETNKETLRKALAMGCDKAVLLKDSSVRDSYSVARSLADYAKEYGADIIFCGKQSIDYDDAQVGALVAEMLGIPSVSVVVKLEIKEGSITAEREIEGGHEVVVSKLPAVICAQKGLNEPRYPSLKGIMDAKRKLIEEKIPAAVESRVEVIAMSNPPAKAQGKIVGTDASAAAELVRLLHEEAKVL
ncbi:MAG: electron transfer flavoprotein subunit beta/FixA family protein [Bacteriovoracaceae bacterium]|nr:electron transfer flavoprotein subunit beta/FixA family protein [Bacteroidota bacterium]